MKGLYNISLDTDIDPCIDRLNEPTSLTKNQLLGIFKQILFQMTKRKELFKEFLITGYFFKTFLSRTTVTVT